MQYLYINDYLFSIDPDFRVDCIGKDIPAELRPAAEDVIEIKRRWHKSSSIGLRRALHRYIQVLAGDHEWPCSVSGNSLILTIEDLPIRVYTNVATDGRVYANVTILPRGGLVWLRKSGEFKILDRLSEAVEYKKTIVAADRDQRRWAEKGEETLSNAAAIVANHALWQRHQNSLVCFKYGLKFVPAGPRLKLAGSTLTFEVERLPRALTILDDLFDVSTDGIDTFIHRVGLARKAILAHIAKKDMKNSHVVSYINCPLCGEGVLKYTYHGHYNKHIQAACTAGCIEWIE